MSFWNFVTDLLPIAVPAAATIYGAKQTSDANNKAAQQMMQAQQSATQMELEKLRQAQENLEVNRRAASPGLIATQEIIARGARLTPEQKMAVQDSRQQAVNSLRGSSLRGSGRATSAIISDVDNRVRNNFMSQNQNAADTAARGLAGQYFGAGQSIANTQAAQGRTASEGLTSTGTIQGANTIGQGAVRGQAIGDVGAIIADSLKDNLAKKRDSSYETITWNN